MRNEERPLSGSLPLFPASWYLLGRSQSVTHRPRLYNVFGRDVVVFRTDRGRVVVMDAYCSHFGASLERGRVEGETIQCPYHGWKYDADGNCTEIPSRCPIPDFARQQTYAVQERLGYVFVFNAATPVFELPWFDDLDAESCVASRPFNFTAHCFWPAVTGHAFDLQHFLYVHDRRLLEPPVIDSPTAWWRRTRYRAEIVARNWRDKVLSLVAGETVVASLEIFGGNVALITARFPRFTSRFMMFMRPVGWNETLCEGIVIADRGLRLSLELRRFFTRAYLVDENRVLGRTRPIPERFVETDAPLREYFQFLEAAHDGGETR